MALITLKEYAERIGKARNAVYLHYRKGNFRTAVKRGRDIWIDEDEPYIDNRVKHGRYVGWRELYDYQRKYRQRKAAEQAEQKTE